MGSEGVHWSGVASNKAVLLLSLESFQNLDSGYALGPLTGVLYRHIHPKVYEAQPPFRVGHTEKKFFPRLIIFTAIMLVHHWSVLVLGLMLESGSTRTVSSQKKQQRNECAQKTLRGQGVDIDSYALTSCRANEKSRYQSIRPAYTRPF